MNSSQKTRLAVCLLLMVGSLLFSQQTDHTWTDQSSFPIHFRILEDPSPFTAAHIVILQVDTNASTPSSFGLTKHGDAAATNIPVGSLPYHDTPAGLIIDLTVAGSLCTLTAEKTPDPPPGGTFTTEEHWVLQVNGLPATNTVDVSIRSRNANEDPPTTDNVDLNVPPTAVISNPAGDVTIDEGQAVPFSGTPADDDPATLSHAWNFSGGASPVSVEDPGSITFNTAGDYLVTYTLIDDVGQSASDSITLVVNPTPLDNPPTGLIIISGAAGTSPFTVSFDGSTSSDDNGIAGYNWDFGDGSSSTGSMVTHTFLTGEYEVQLTVTDTIGQPGTEQVTIQALPNQALAFPAHRGVPYAPQPPTIDGQILPEEWRGTQRLTYSTGAPPADLAFQGLKHRSEAYLYLAFEVKKDQSFDADDLIVMAFRPDAATGGTANDRKLFLFPFAAGHTAGTNQDPEQLRIWKDSNGWPTELSPAQVAAIGIEAKLKSYDADGHQAWDVELKIPTTAVTPDWVDFADEFLFYFNVNKVRSVPPPPPAPQVPTDIQFIWPRGVPAATGDVYAYAFDPQWWGRGNKSGTAVLKGVYIRPEDIGTTNSPPSRILLPATDPGSAANTFTATVWNQSERETTLPPDYAEPVAADGVRVRLRIANWGIPGPSDWRDLPATSGIDPSAPPGLTITPTQTVLAASAGVPGQATYTLGWTISRPSTDYDNYVAHFHQCMLVEIDSTSTANIETRSVYRNMNFGSASDFSQVAEISTRGCGAPPAGSQGHTYLLVITPHDLGTSGDDEVIALTTTDRKSPGSANRHTSSFEWAAHGFLYTGRQIIINGNRYELLTPAGSFGHRITHEGSVVDWEYEIQGAKKVEENLYVVGVPEDGVVRVTPSITPREFWPFALSLHAGSVSPLGALASAQGTGAGGFADFGWRFSRQWILTLLSGVSWFSGLSGNPPYWILQASVAARYLLPVRGSLIPYLQAGGGLHYDDAGSLGLGVQSGVGAAYDFSRHLSAELGIDYHGVPALSAQFVSVHGGIVLRF